MANKNRKATQSTKEAQKYELGPVEFEECAAHGKLAAMMQFHYSEEMRVFLNWMWEGFWKGFRFDEDPDDRLKKKILRVRDRVATLHLKEMRNSSVSESLQKEVDRACEHLNELAMKKRELASAVCRSISDNMKRMARRQIGESKEGQRGR